MILSRHPAIFNNPPGHEHARAVKISSSDESSFIIEYADVIEHTELSYTGTLEHDPLTGNFIGRTLEGDVFEFDVSKNSGILNGYQPLDTAKTPVELPDGQVINHANASLMVTEYMAILSGYGIEVIRFYEPAVRFFDEITYPGKTDNRLYGEKKLEMINPVNGQVMVATLYDQGCGCATENIQQKLGSVKIFPIDG